MSKQREADVPATGWPLSSDFQCAVASWAEELAQAMGVGHALRKRLVVEAWPHCDQHYAYEIERYGEEEASRKAARFKITYPPRPGIVYICDDCLADFVDVLEEYTEEEEETLRLRALVCAAPADDAGPRHVDSFSINGRSFEWMPAGQVEPPTDEELAAWAAE